MGWARTLLLGDIGNRLDIGDAERDIAALRKSLRSKGRVDRAQDARLAEIEKENDQLKLCLAALMRLLVAKGIVLHAELAGFADVIDAEEEGGSE